ncbi:hypothetical protein MMC29_005184, partial [Sticta canariensis]|nr:hypothetical protein [Sticta canariensis]
MVLKGVNYLKDKQNPVAEEDDKYPDWLWSLLDKVEGAGGKNSEAETKADMYSKSKKKRRQAMQKARSALLNPQSAKIPYEHQTIDLPTFDLNDLDTTKHKEGRDEVDPNVPHQMQHEAQMAAQRAQKAREKL